MGAFEVGWVLFQIKTKLFVFKIYLFITFILRFR